MHIDQLLNFSISLMVSIATLLIISLGLALLYGMMGVTNLAHGEFLMLGAYTVLTAVKAGLNIWLAMLLAPVVVGLLGIVIERLIIRHLYKRMFDTMLATWGLGLLLAQLVVIIYGPATNGIATPLGSFQLGTYSVSKYSLFLIVMAVVLLAVTYWIFNRTRYGLMARAATQNKEMASALGIDSERINMITFGFGSALAGAGGALLAPLTGVMPSMGGAFVAKAFMTVVVGGQLVISGTTAASGILGLVDNLVSYLFTPIIGQTAILIIAIVLLRIMKRGLSGNWRLPL